MIATQTSALLLLAWFPAAHDPPRYDLHVLQEPSGAIGTNALRINDAGVCVGGFFNAETGYFDGLIWTASGEPIVMSEVYGFSEISALGVDGGTVLGSGSTDPLEVSKGVLVQPGGTVQSLPSLAGDDGVNSAAWDVNAEGTVVGRSATFATPFWFSTFNDAVTWKDGAVSSLGTLGGFFAEAKRINDAGTIIGASNTRQSDFMRGFVYDEVGGMREITPAEPGGTGQVRDLDEQGRICGSATQGTASFACVWGDPDQPPSFLPNLPGDVSSNASAMDESGNLVGSASAGSLGGEARLWWDGEVYDLGELLAEPAPGPLVGAADVNEVGQILVTFDERPGGFTYGVLTPRPHLSGEPASISVGAGGTQELELAGGPDLAGGLYLVLGSLSGTEPGLSVGGFVLPLNSDAYLIHTLTSPHAPPLVGAIGTLDAAGAGQATFTLPAGSAPELVGLEVHHAYGAIDIVTGAILGTSNAVSLSLDP